MHLPLGIADAPGRPCFTFADGDKRVRERGKHSLGQTVERAETRLHFKGEAVRGVDDARSCSERGDSSDETGFRAVKVDDVGLELANKAPKADCGPEVTQRGWAAPHVDFREADAVRAEKTDVTDEIVVSQGRVCDMDIEAAFAEPKGEVAQMAARTSNCRLQHEEYANGVRAWRSGFHGFRFEPRARR